MKNKVITIILIGVFSIILWGAISLNEEYFTGIKMPVKFLYSADSNAVSNVSVEEVTLNIKGQGWQLAKLVFSDDLSFSIKTHNRFGKQEVSLKSELDNNSWFSTNLQITEIIPDKISFFVEHAAFKKVKIVPNLKLSFSEGYIQTDSLRLSKDSVTIYGPASELGKIKQVNTKYYEFTNLDKKIRERVELEPHKLFGYKFNSIFVTIDAQKMVDKTFESVVIEPIEVPETYNLQLIPHQINIKLRGGLSELGKMSSEEIKLFVKFNSAFYDTLGYLVPEVKLPPFTQVIEMEPQKIEYIIKQR
jgi:YbbR domain-containing protein